MLIDVKKEVKLKYKERPRTPDFLGPVTDLFRLIDYVCSDLFAEAVAASLYGKKINQENLDALLRVILSVHNDFIRRISHPEPGLPAKAYYKVIINDFNTQVNEIVDHIQNL